MSPLRSKDILQVDLSLLGIGHFVPWESEVFSACGVCREMLRRSRADTTAVKAWHQKPRMKIAWHPGWPLLSVVIDFTMLPAKRFWRETVSLLEVMWPRGNKWERALLARKNSSYMTIRHNDLLGRSAYVVLLLVWTRVNIESVRLHTSTWLLRWFFGFSSWIQMKLREQRESFCKWREKKSAK